MSSMENSDIPGLFEKKNIKIKRPDKIMNDKESKVKRRERVG